MSKHIIHGLKRIGASFFALFGICLLFLTTILASKRSTKNLWASLLVLTVFLGFSLLLGEFGLRLLLKDKIGLFPRYHTSAQYGDFTIRRMRPDTVFWHTSIDGTWRFTTNAQGFRNHRDFSYEKSPDVIRIFSLGDSHTAGFEVRQERTFSAIIERHLQDSGVQAEVINAGVSGFSTAEELVLLENEGIKYQPDVVVLGFFANDFIDNLKAGLFALEENRIVVKKRRHIPGVRILEVINTFAILRWLSENSYLYSFAFNNVWRLAKRSLTTKAKAKLQTEYAISIEEADDYQQELAMRLIERMYKYCEEHKILFIILDIPQRSKGREIRSSVPPTLVERMRSNSHSFIYSKEVLQGHSNVTEFHLPHGAHISELTHFLLGVAIAKILLASTAEI